MQRQLFELKMILQLTILIYKYLGIRCKLIQTQIYINYYRIMNNFSLTSFQPCQSVGTLTMVNVQQIQRQQNLDYLEHLCTFIDRMKINPLWYENEQLDNKLKVLQIYQLAINYSKNMSSSYDKQLANLQKRVQSLRSSKDDRVQRIRDHKQKVSKLKLKYKLKKHKIYQVMYNNLKNKLRDESDNGHNGSPYYYPMQEPPAGYHPQYAPQQSQHFTPREQPYFPQQPQHFTPRQQPPFSQPYHGYPQSQSTDYSNPISPPRYPPPPSGNPIIEAPPFDRRQSYHQGPPFIQPHSNLPSQEQEQPYLDPTFKKILSNKIMEGINNNEANISNKNPLKHSKKEMKQKEDFLSHEDKKTDNTPDLFKSSKKSIGQKKNQQKKSQIKVQRKQQGNKDIDDDIFEDQLEQQKTPATIKSSVQNSYKMKSKIANDRHQQDINSIIQLKLQAESKKIVSTVRPSAIENNNNQMEIDLLASNSLMKSKFSGSNPSANQGQRVFSTKPIKNKPGSGIIRKTEENSQQGQNESFSQLLGKSKVGDVQVLISDVRQMKFGKQEQNYLKPPSRIQKKPIDDSINLFQSNRGQINNKQKNYQSNRVFGSKPQKNISNENLPIIDEQATPQSKRSISKLKVSQAESEQIQVSNLKYVEQSHTTSVKFNQKQEPPQLPKQIEEDLEEEYYEGEDFEDEQDDGFDMNQMMQSKKPASKTNIKEPQKGPQINIEKSEVNIKLTSIASIKDPPIKYKYVKLVNEIFTLKKPASKLNIPNITASIRSSNIGSSDDFLDQIMEIPENSCIGVRPSVIKKISPSRISKNIESFKKIDADQSSIGSKVEGGSSFSINLIDPTGNRQKVQKSKQSIKEIQQLQRSKTDMIKLNNKETLQSRCNDNLEMIKLNNKDPLQSRYKDSLVQSLCMDNLEQSVVSGHAHKLNAQQQILAKIRSAQKTAVTNRNPKKFNNKWIDDVIQQQLQVKLNDTATVDQWLQIKEAFEEQLEELKAKLATKKKGEEGSRGNRSYNQNISQSYDDLKYSQSLLNTQFDVRKELKIVEPIKEMTVSMEFKDDPKGFKQQSVSKQNQYLRKVGEKQSKGKTNYHDKLIIGLKQGSNYDQENIIDKAAAEYLTKKRQVDDDDF